MENNVTMEFIDEMLQSCDGRIKTYRRMLEGIQGRPILTKSEMINYVKMLKFEQKIKKKYEKLKLGLSK